MSRIRFNPKSIQGAVSQMVGRVGIDADVLRAVNVNWNDDGWNVNANSVADSNEWNAGNQVISRNCCFLSSIWREFCFEGLFSIRPAYARFRGVVPKG